jgi:hypothetical protein
MVLHATSIQMPLATMDLASSSLTVPEYVADHTSSMIVKTATTLLISSVLSNSTIQAACNNGPFLKASLKSQLKCVVPKVVAVATTASLAASVRA